MDIIDSTKAIHLLPKCQHKELQYFVNENVIRINCLVCPEFIKHDFEKLSLDELRTIALTFIEPKELYKNFPGFGLS